MDREHCFGKHSRRFSLHSGLTVQVAEVLKVPFHEVDAHNTVPCWLASPKKETAARTIRPKIHKQLPEFLTVRSAAQSASFSSIAVSNIMTQIAWTCLGL